MNPRSRASRGALVFLALTVLAGASAVFAQRIRLGEGSRLRVPAKWASAEDFDGSWNYCRGWFASNRREASGYGWSTDFPGADNNFSVRLAELTYVPVRFGLDQQPVHVVVRLNDPTLFRCTLVFLEDAGTIRLRDTEIASLRAYLSKGGFIWADDFWGSRALSQFTEEIGRVLPPKDYPVIDIPPDHPIMHTLYDVKAIPQVSNMQFWYRNKGAVSERGTETARVSFRGIEDRNGRLVVVMTHNTDISDSWEREGENSEYFERFSPAGYAVGVNIVLYAMTH